jgi:hypothetical protein
MLLVVHIRISEWTNMFILSSPGWTEYDGCHELGRKVKGILGPRSGEVDGKQKKLFKVLVALGGTVAAVGLRHAIGKLSEK